MSGGPTDQSQWTYARPSVPRRRTSSTEIWQIAVAFVVLTLDMSFVLVQFRAAFGATAQSLLSSLSLGIVLVGAASALTGFLGHELAHKAVAQRLGYWAEFRWFPIGLLFSLLLAYTLGFLFAAPGATVVSGMDYSERRGWGRTALAGPASNAGFSVVFYAAAIGTVPFGSFVTSSLLFLAFINAWFGTFNLIPVGPLDGAKVLRWSAAYWGVAIVALAGLAALAYVGWVYGSPFFHLG